MTHAAIEVFEEGLASEESQKNISEHKKMKGSNHAINVLT